MLQTSCASPRKLKAHWLVIGCEYACFLAFATHSQLTQMPGIHLYRPRSFISSSLPRKVSDRMRNPFGAITQMAHPHVTGLAQPAAKLSSGTVCVVQL